MPEEIIQWDKLTPEERNRLVTEKVMGNAPYVSCPGMVVNTRHKPAGAPQWHIWQCDTCKKEYIESKDKYLLHSRLPHSQYFAEKPDIPKYSESMDAAMQVLEHERFMHATIEYDRSWRDETTLVKTYSVVIFPYDMHGGVGVTANTLPHAICIASLKAVGCTFAEDEEE